ncbi:cysteine desulfurase NifS [archaeon]|nr:MAG: cysteine desulfurase NifS [archaeon]
MKRVYLDNSATTAVDRAVIETMLPYFDKAYGNASSFHSFGREAARALESARDQVATLIGAKPSEIYFTAGGTESDNIAILGIAYANRDKGNHIITSAIEHPAVLETCRHLEESGFKVTYLPVDIDGRVSLSDLRDAITEETILITIMHANNEIGTIQHVRDMGALARDRNIAFHTDAVQSIGKVPLDVEFSNIDLLSISSHKLHGPKGVGALYVREGTAITPVIFGGGHERGLRPSTENVPGIVGFGKACEIAHNRLDEDIEHMSSLRDKLIKGILDAIPKSVLNGPCSDRLCNNVNISFEAVEGEALILALDRVGIAASTGSACSSKKSTASHVLLATGLSEQMAYGSLRISLSRFTTEDDIGYVLEKLPPIVERLRSMSPLWKEE